MAHETRLEMPLDEVSSLVNSEGWLVLGTIGDDGIPTAEVVPCSADETTLTFTIPVSSASFANIQQDDRVCAVIENAEHEFYRMRSVTVHGRANRMEAPTIGGQARYAVTLDDIVSFDFSKIQIKH